MRRGNWKFVVLRDFSGGMVSRPAKHMLQPNQWADLQNVRLTEHGSVKKRGGSTKLTSTPLIRYE